MSGTLLLDWKIGQFEYAYFEYKATPDKVGTIFDLSVSRQGFSDTPLKAKSCEIEVINNTLTYSFASYVDIEIDGVHKRVFAKYQFNTENTQSIKITGQTAGAVKFKFYSEEVFDYTYYDRLFSLYLSDEPTDAIVYTMNVKKISGVWCWDVNNTSPFNSGDPVSTPLKLRDANPNRSQFYLDYWCPSTVAQCLTFSTDGVMLDGSTYLRNTINPFPMFFSVGNTNYTPINGRALYDPAAATTFSLTSVNSGMLLDDSVFGGAIVLDKQFAPIFSMSITGTDTANTNALIGNAFNDEIWVKVLPLINAYDSRTFVNATLTAKVY